MTPHPPNGPSSIESEGIYRGNRAVRWISNLTLCDDFAGKPFNLRPWQADGIIRPIFGTLRPDGLRRYRKALLMFPRKQAKTQLSAGIGGYCLLGEGKTGQETVCAAADREQASHLFKKVYTMIEADAELRRRVKVYTSSRVIEARKSGNVFKVLSADGRRQHGLNPAVLLFDELHTQRTRDLYDALTSAQATRAESLQIMISTAGNVREGVCWDELQYARKVKADPNLDPSYLPILYGADDDDDWTAEATWRKAMPALGDFCRIDFIRDELRKALESPSEESKFRQLYLNQWVASVAKWLNRSKWDACGAHRFDPAELVGRPCYGGLDLSNTSDVTAYVLVFPYDDGTFRVLCWFWIPEAYARKRDRKERKRRFFAWSRSGAITLTPGDVIDYDHIKAKIVETSKRYDVRSLRIDPFSGTQIALQLRDLGIAVEFMRQGFLSMNEPVKYLDTLVALERLHHNGHEVLTWMAENVVTARDEDGNVKFSKGQSAEKIDGMVALAMGTAGATLTPPEGQSDFIKL